MSDRGGVVQLATTLPKEQKDELDKFAKEKGMTIAAVVQFAIQDYINRNQRQPQLPEGLARVIQDYISQYGLQ